ncbi:hypothetical protein Tco_0265594 [Tanacetum coccineum]
MAPGNLAFSESRHQEILGTKPNNELIHYCLQNPPYNFNGLRRTVLVAEGIDNDIYSIVDACLNACEMWKPIERLKQGTLVVQKSGIQCYQLQGIWHVSRECQKPKRVKDGSFSQEINVIVIWKHIFVHGTTFKRLTPDPVDNSRPILMIEPMHKDETDELDQERDLLASLIQKLKCEIDDSKNRNNFLESSNKKLVNKLKDLKKFQAELDKYKDVNYGSKVEINCAKAKGDLIFLKVKDSLSPGPKSQENVPQVAETVTTSNELELLYSPMFSELLNGTSSVVFKVFRVHAAVIMINVKHTQLHFYTTNVEDPPPLNIPSNTSNSTQYQLSLHLGTIIQQKPIQKMHNLTTMNLSTSLVHRYKNKGRHRLVMLIRQTCILSINTILPHNVGQKIIH